MVLVAAAVARAQPGAPAGPAAQADRTAALQQAQRLELAAQERGSDDAYAACGMAYLDLYNEQEEAVEAPSLLEAAARCFERGKSVGVAIGLYEQLERAPRAGGLAAVGLLRKAKLLERLADLPRAAAAYEAFARRFPGEAEERAALASAVTLYGALGDDARQVAALSYLVRRFGAAAPRQVAELVLAATPAYERRGVAAAISHLRAHQALFAEAEPAVALRASARLAGLLWAQSCPGGGQEGLCLRALPAPRPRGGAGRAGPPLRCGEGEAPLLVVIARGAAAKAAQSEHDLIVARWQVQAPATWEPAVRHAVAMVQLARADRELEALLTLQFPQDLDFDPDRPSVRARSDQRMSAFFQSLMQAAQRAQARYEEVIASKDAIAAIAAAARLGFLRQRFAAVLRLAPIPRDVRRGSYAEDKVEAFCGQLDELARPLLEGALEAYRVCAERAASLGISTAASRRCVQELTRLQPTSSLAANEVAPAPSAAMLPMEPEPEVAVGLLTPAQAAFLTRFVSERATWSVDGNACGQLAAGFATTGAAGRYMAGLTYQVCGRAADARAAYQAAVASAQTGEGDGQVRARAASNLALLQWQAGDRAGGAAAWQAALAAWPTLFAARVNLAAARLVEARALPPSDPRRQRALEESRGHGSAAAALADHPAAFVLLGVQALERREVGVAEHYLQRARALAPASPYVATLAGVLAAARSDVWSLEPFQRAVEAAPASAEARANLGFAYLQLGRWSEARATLAPLAGAGYDVELARGVAARGVGDYDAAEAHYRAAAALAPNRPETAFDVGVLWKHYRAAAASEVEARKAALTAAAEAFRRSSLPQAAELASAADCERRVLEAGKPLRLGRGCGPR